MGQAVEWSCSILKNSLLFDLGRVIKSGWILSGPADAQTLLRWIEVDV